MMRNLNDCIHLNLYSTSHCHLCDEATSLLVTLSQRINITWQEIEITDNETLLQRYGDKIPVLQIASSSEELNWPFSLENICQFIHIQSK